MFPATLRSAAQPRARQWSTYVAAIGYIRKSRVDTRRKGAISREQQVEAIKAMARREGDDPDAIEWIEDWGRSGAIDKQHLRQGFAALEAAVKSGNVQTIYAYNMSRLARSLETLARLANLCEEHNVALKCTDGLSPDCTSATGRMILGILGSIYAWQSEWTKERAIEAIAIKRADKKHIGPAPYGYTVKDTSGKLVRKPSEDINVVIEAFKRSGGSYERTARALDAQGVPTRLGRPWRDSSVKVMVLREAPEMVEALRR